MKTCVLQITPFFLLLAIVSAQEYCSTTFYQVGYYTTYSEYDSYTLYSYNYNDTSCSMDYERVEMEADSSTAIHANSSSTKTVQMNLIQTKGNSAGFPVDWSTDFELCDGIKSSTQCTGDSVVYTTCYDETYIFYPPGEDNRYPRICKAAVISGDIQLDDTGAPYGVCDNCILQTSRRSRHTV